MQLRARTARLSRIAAATAAVALTLTLAACGSDEEGSDAAASATSTTSAAAATTTAAGGHGHSADEAPTAESLQTSLNQISSPDVTTEEKVKLIVNGENRRDNIDKLNAALQTYRGITFQVADVKTEATTTTAQVTITNPMGQTAPAMPLTWEHQDNSWKLSDQSACLLFGFAQVPCVPV